MRAIFSPRSRSRSSGPICSPPTATSYMTNRPAGSNQRLDNNSPTITPACDGNNLQQSPRASNSSPELSQYNHSNPSSGGNSPNSPRRNAVFGLSSGNQQPTDKNKRKSLLPTEKQSSGKWKSRMSGTLLTSEDLAEAERLATQSNNTPSENVSPYIIVTLKSGEDLISCDRNGFSDPFCIMHYKYLPTASPNSTESGLTSLLLSTEKLIETKKSEIGGDEHFQGAIIDELEITVWDFDLFQANEFMGSARVPLSQLLRNQTQKFVLRLEGVAKGFLNLEITAQHCGLQLPEIFPMSSTNSTQQDDRGSDVTAKFEVDNLLENNQTLKALYDEYLHRKTYTYELIQPLGEGAYGIVYRALRVSGRRDSTSKEIVALKKVKIDNIQSALEILYEVSVTRNCLDMGPLATCPYLMHHNRIFLDNISLPIMDKNSHMTNDELTICFEMPLYDLGDLQRFLEMKQRKGKKMALPTFVSYLRQLSEALSMLHYPELRQGGDKDKNNIILIHRDIKPQNIFLLDDYQTLKLGDFSFLIKKTTEHSQEEAKETEMKTTKLCGSIPHMAPELYIHMHEGDSNSEEIQSETDAIDLMRKTDVFSFGVIAYQLVTFNTKIDHTFYHRIMPSGMVNVYQTSKKSQVDKYQDFMDELEFEINKMMTNEKEELFADSLKDLILGCLDWNPSKRKSANECWSELKQMEEHLAKDILTGNDRED